jgi:hypothetical protein
MQFSIRDLLWAKLLAATAMAGWTDHLRMEDRMDQRREEHQSEVAALKPKVASLKMDLAAMPRGPAGNLLK